MNLSYWELKNWFTNVDYTIVGSGIVGLHAALRLREKFPESKILILEKGMLPEGASTKNAGFACFGSLSEIIDDLKSHTEEEVIQLVQKRWQGLQLLRKNLGDEALDFKPFGGYELFLKNDESTYYECLQKLPFINNILKPIFKAEVFEKNIDRFGFNNIQEYTIFNPFEAQIDTGNMMQTLLKKAQSNGILILNNQTVSTFHDNEKHVQVQANDFTFNTKKLLFATNGFAEKLTKNQVKPARAQVLITAPIPNLDIKGTFHLDKGYYYFRNINDRILFGGGRNLNFEDENTSQFGETEIIQNKLEEMLKTVILPNTNFKIAHRWSGIMGLGNSKRPIVEALSENVYCGVRLGGMGVAIGSLVGQELADLI
ncbi:FAD-binding oxidoreductase [Flavobacterium psychrophilum]|uniref:NAD(P)/FAD-dependent oxidoreductase n=1 Tax=Flavobacterium psychrophilum TaxID=96345 RepID=UPI001C8F56C0|nr:FAD-dependent oxidoreductase [Flavobacterium psychrophilum]EKT4498565.1 FAD-binding oxidoreductase [Flavobacterium psychrophilum]ELM3649984.1 FAD-binding oxidoreductase [Flavobacterium psychrophilum]ELM3670964.1 FAD-binding oxidoreductase [Flavobacterium psychrophilum]ELM3725210.1 FAD-binding oxidoreductase [Flavobacterium psychrophilum]ELY1992741.1 FAD-binding oxidoreductase [Flavobacterium psychrophilum]